MLAIVATLSCASHTRLDTYDIGKVQEALRDQPRWLRSSMWEGPFYSDRGRRLIAVQDFARLRHIQDLDGNVISPPPAEGVVPAGTVVVVRDVEFPTGWNVFWRSFDTPKYSTWVLLHVPRFHSDKEYVLVVDDAVKTHQELIERLDAWLTTDDVASWLDRRPVVIRDAIGRKDVVAGMSAEDLRASAGAPESVRRTFDGEGHERQVWVYGSRQVIMEEGQVIAVERVDETGAGNAAAATPAPPGVEPATGATPPGAP
jgi:hypothetical protein